MGSKHQISAWKLRVPDQFRPSIVLQGFLTLPFSEDHAFERRNLPMHHRDRFDRAMIAQARLDGYPRYQEGFTFVACDGHAKFRKRPRSSGGAFGGGTLDAEWIVDQ